MVRTRTNPGRMFLILGRCFLVLGKGVCFPKKISKKSDLKWLKKKCASIYTKQKNPDLDPQSPAQSNLEVKDYRN